MTRQEFDNTPVSAKTIVKISGLEYEIFSVDWEKGLIEVKDVDGILTVPYKFCEYKIITL